MTGLGSNDKRIEHPTVGAIRGPRLCRPPMCATTPPPRDLGVSSDSDGSARPFNHQRAGTGFHLGTALLVFRRSLARAVRGALAIVDGRAHRRPATDPATAHRITQSATTSPLAPRWRRRWCRHLQSIFA